DKMGTFTSKQEAYNLLKQQYDLVNTQSTVTTQPYRITSDSNDHKETDLFDFMVNGGHSNQAQSQSRAMNEFELYSKEEQIPKTIETIVASACKQQQEQIIELTVELDRTKSELEKVSSHLNDLKQYGKRKDLLIYGIPVKNDENLYTTVMELGNALGTKLNRNNFNAIHRLPAKRTGDKLKSTII
ncbi:unnamed protein product, partial [Didymodactylos carnosus]